MYCIQRDEEIAKLLSQLHHSSFLDSDHRYPIPSKNPYSGGVTVKYTKGGENLRFSTEIAVYLGNEIGPWMLWNINRTSQPADRSVSVPMTLSDLERRDARGHYRPITQSSVSHGTPMSDGVGPSNRNIKLYFT